MWVKLLKDHDWPLGPSKVIAYKADQVFDLREETASELVADGVAEDYPEPALWQQAAILEAGNREPEEWPRKPRAVRLAEEAEASAPKPKASKAKAEEKPVNDKPADDA